MSTLPLNSLSTAVVVGGQIPLLSNPDEPFIPLRWIVIMMGRWSDDRVSSGSQSYLSQKAAWMIVTSGEGKGSVAGSCLVG